MKRQSLLIFVAIVLVETGYAQNRPRYEQLKPIEFTSLSSTGVANGLIPVANGSNAVAWKSLTDLPPGAGVLPSINGGTGVNNGTNTITLGGNLTTIGANSLTFTTTGPTNITLPISGTLMSSANSFANPSAIIGLTANNGSATMVMRSDASPALSQAIVPIWTGVHTFTNQVILGTGTGATAGTIVLHDANDGNSYATTIKANAAIANPGYTLTLPAAAPAQNGQVLSGSTGGALSWVNAATGTVTSVGGTGTVSGLSLSGTVTTSGNLTLGGTLAVAASNFASQTANTFLAAPNGTAGVPTFRTLDAADIPSLNWAKITSGKPTTLLGYGITDAASSSHAHTFASLTSIPTTLLGYGITDAQAKDADLTSIAGLAGTSGLLKKTAADTWVLDAGSYLTSEVDGSITNEIQNLSYTATSRVLAIDGTGSTDVTLPEVTTTDAGLMSSTDKVKLNGITAGAEVNVNADWNAASGDAQILNKPTTFTPAAHNHSTTEITSGTLGVARGGTGIASYTAGNYINASGATTLQERTPAQVRADIGAGTGNGTVTSVGGTGTVSGLSLSGTVTISGNLTLGGTLAVAASNFASQTANTFLAAPNSANGVPTFRAIVASDIPPLNQNTTGTAASITGTYSGTITSGQVTTGLGFTPYNATNPNHYIPLTALSSTATGLTYTNTTGVFSLTSGYSIPTTTDQTNWNKYNQWDGGSTGLNATTGRTSLGATTVGGNLFTLANPSDIRFLRVNANNSVSALDAAEFRTAIGVGTGYTAGNGLSLSGSIFKLGGTLSEATTVTMPSTYSLIFDAESGSGNFQIKKGTGTFVVYSNNGNEKFQIDADGTAFFTNNLDIYGKLKTKAVDGTSAGLNIPHGTAPTSPANGDVWTTSTAMYARINGTTEQLTTVSLGTNTFLSRAGGTMTGKLNTVASAAGDAGLKLPHGTAPTSPDDGDIWTTTGGLYARIDGTTEKFAPVTWAASTYMPLAGGIMTGKLNTVASAAGRAGLKLPHGTAPTSPDDGDIWTTTGGLFARINNSTVNLGSPYTFSNGLTNSSGTVKLGGTLTGSTTINLGTQQLTFNSTSSLQPIVFEIGTSSNFKIFYNTSSNAFSLEGATGNGLFHRSLTIDEGLRVGGTGIDISAGGLDVVGNSIFSNDLTVNGNFYNPSDKRLKRDVETLSGVMDRINQIRGVHFEFINPNKYATGSQIGVIAQELQQVYPELVATGDDGFLKVNYTQLTAVLLQGMKEQQQQINELKERVNQQGQRLDAQQKQIDEIINGFKK